MQEELIRVKASSLSRYPTGNGVIFCLCDVTGSEYRQLHGFCTCKSYVLDVINNLIFGGACGSAYAKEEELKNTSFDFSRLTLLVSYIHGREYIKHAVKLLHAIEERLGFRKTICKPASIIGAKDTKANLMFLDADASWLHSPVLVETYTCIIRLNCRYRHEGKHKPIETIADLLYAAKNNQAANAGASYTDLMYLREAAKSGRLDVLFDEGASLFGDCLKRNWGFTTGPPYEHPNVHHKGIHWWQSAQAAAEKKAKSIRTIPIYTTLPDWWKVVPSRSSVEDEKSA